MDESAGLSIAAIPSPLWTENKRMRAVIAQQREELAAKERRIAELEETAADARAAETAKLLKLRDDVNQILDGLNPQDFHEAINWGDLFCAEAMAVYDMRGRTSLRVVIQEAAEDCYLLAAAVEARLKERGWESDRIAVHTEW